MCVNDLCFSNERISNAENRFSLYINIDNIFIYYTVFGLTKLKVNNCYVYILNIIINILNLLKKIIKNHHYLSIINFLYLCIKIEINNETLCSSLL